MNLGSVDLNTITAPIGWRVIEQRLDGVAAERLGVLVIISCAEESDGAVWIHLSLSRADHLPSNLDLRNVKNAWLGDREAYQVFPSAARYVNIHPHVLHLFSRRDAPDGVLPHFEGVIDGSVTL